MVVPAARPAPPFISIHSRLCFDGFGPGPIGLWWVYLRFLFQKTDERARQIGCFLNHPQICSEQKEVSLGWEVALEVT
jgi:hypothetical protein